MSGIVAFTSILSDPNILRFMKIDVDIEPNANDAVIQDVEMPVGADFGVENKKGSSKNKRGGNLSSLTGDDADQQQNQEGLTMEKLETSNRELARLFVEMFQPLGGTHISAIFNDELLADQARERWSGDLSVECNIQAIDRKGYKTRNKILKTKGMGNGGKKKKKAKGFAAKMAEEMEEDGASSSSSGPFALPTDTEVAIFVAPGPKELIAVERICNEAGMGTCVILLNARLSLVEKYATEEAADAFRGLVRDGVVPGGRDAAGGRSGVLDAQGVSGELGVGEEAEGGSAEDDRDQGGG
eukprot:CAMPEP_0201668440 /NCGR_PEP_ID=MMETSP0494-20130426/19437_1 /ASSEMBLY_ACC=CAM_ASM_000839 /TAXON_ID=420259 /ORGANISM="Thalassiosira gravida, Strain GMp14c1" /LENGTH=298 /DNA_ID=CAMNT_0048148813 /DNA_START=115 /DNA_END=1009 /DNA_ORIENTATION=+